MSFCTRRLVKSSFKLCSFFKNGFNPRRLVVNNRLLFNNARQFSLYSTKFNLLNDESLTLTNESFIPTPLVEVNEESVTVKGDAPEPIKSFSDIEWPLGIKEVLDNKGFNIPTTIQANAIPIVLSNKDLVGIAKTGCGKTLAYLLPAFMISMENSSNRKPRSPIAVVLAPTRELVQQIEGVVEDFSEIVTSLSVFGGVSRMHQERAINKKNPKIIIATPGRLIDFIQSNVLNLSHIKYLVLDEADRMLDMGFEPQIRDIVEAVPDKRQTVMFSATWPKEVRELAEDFLKNYTHLTIGSTELHANPNITQIIDVCNEVDKRPKLASLVAKLMSEEDQKILIFAQTKRTVDFLVRFLESRNFSVSGIHGDRTQRQRDISLNDFRTNRANILIATDVAARGLDVNDIKCVINYDFPSCSEDYVHRIGRTGRVNKKGTAYTFFTDEDGGKAKDLIEILKKTNQPINSQLYDISKRTHLMKMDKYRKPGQKLNSNWRSNNSSYNTNRYHNTRSQDTFGDSNNYRKSYNQSSNRYQNQNRRQNYQNYNESREEYNF